MVPSLLFLHCARFGIITAHFQPSGSFGDPGLIEVKVPQGFEDDVGSKSGYALASGTRPAPFDADAGCCDGACRN